jgi:transcriptional regulatory protein RtcR
MKKVVIGLLGSQLDRRGRGEDRWDRWRPTVSLFQHEDLLVERMELLYEEAFESLMIEVSRDVKQVSPQSVICPHAVNFGGDAWDFEKVYGALYDWAKAYPFDTETEEYLIHITTGTHVAQICLFLLTEAGFLPAKLIQTSPPAGGKRARSLQPRYDVIDLDLSKYDKLSTRFEEQMREDLDFLKSGIQTKNESFNQMIERIEQVALRSKEPILLSGPTGAGKSQLARRIYELRQQRGGLRGNFVDVNCATLRGDLAASTLFGHVKGSFTGAQKDRPGLLREAHGGLLFLDEIGELGLDEQAMLLRALEDKIFLPVGSDKMVKSDFQLIAGTNRDLRKDVAEGKFREDLLARIHLWSFTLPSLAQRREDIMPNIEYELRRYAEKQGRSVSFNKEAREAFLQFAYQPTTTWLGNFRDLNAAITRMATLAPRGRITTDDVSEEIERLQQSWERPGHEECWEEFDLTHVFSAEEIAAIDPFDRAQLVYVLGVCRESVSLSDAGRKLFAVSREKRAVANDADRLKKYLKKFGVTFDQIKR